MPPGGWGEPSGSYVSPYPTSTPLAGPSNPPPPQTALASVSSALGTVLDVVGAHFEAKQRGRELRGRRKQARWGALASGLLSPPAVQQQQQQHAPYGAYQPNAPYAPYGGAYGPMNQPQMYPPAGPAGPGMYPAPSGPPLDGPRRDAPASAARSRDSRVPMPYNVVGSNPQRLEKEGPRP